MSFTWVRPVNPQAGGAPRAADLLAAASAGNEPQLGAAAAGPVDDQRQAQLGKTLEAAFHFLKDNAPAHPGLASAISAMHTAVATFQSGGDTVTQLERVRDEIDAQRQLDPSIPQP